MILLPRKTLISAGALLLPTLGNPRSTQAQEASLGRSLRALYLTAVVPIVVDVPRGDSSRMPVTGFWVWKVLLDSGGRALPGNCCAGLGPS